MPVHSRGAPRRQQQRAQILAAMVEVVAERGLADTSIRLVTTRARVSRRTFGKHFSSLEDCLTAILDFGLERATALVMEALEGEETLHGGVQMALASLLVLLDCEPSLARIWLVESLGAGEPALKHRERNLILLRNSILAHPARSDMADLPSIMVDCMIASVFGILHSHMAAGRSAPLIDLLGPLMGLIVAPYMSPHVITREIERGESLARQFQAGLGLDGMCRESFAGRLRMHYNEHGALQWPNLISTGASLPPILENPNAQRARQALLFVAANPNASNRQIAAGIGVVHQPQISRLLACLLSERLMCKRSEGHGKLNAWRLTSRGEEVLKALQCEESS
jgi:AcrR family transcriptional regulator